MSDAPDKQSLLSAFDLGPSWARDKETKKYDEHRGEDRGRDRGPDRGGQRGRQQGGGDRSGGRREGGDRGDRGGDRGGYRPQGRGPAWRDQAPRELPAPAQGVRVEISPAKEAVHLVVKEIHHVARVYSLFDIAQILLAGRDRFRMHVSSDPKRPPMFRGLKDESLFLTKEEAVAHFWQSDAAGGFYESEDSETEAPAGNFQVVARCGMSGEWLGPPNFHAYQTNLRRLHRERFSDMRFEAYASRVKTERGEEAVNQWLDTMKKRVRWRPKGGGDDAWTFDRAVVERDFTQRLFGEAFQETRDTTISGNVPAQNLSVGIMAAVRIAGSHARKHPAMLIPAICRMLEAEHLAVFKRQGKLFSGPARPHPLEVDGALSDRPKAIVDWLDTHPEAKLGELWTSVLPADVNEAPKEWLVDLFWLLTQGHVLLFSDDTLVLPKRRAATAPAAPKAPGVAKKKRKKRKRKLYKARHPSPAKLIRRVSRTPEKLLKGLGGEAKIWKRRLERRGRIASLVEDY